MYKSIHSAIGKIQLVGVIVLFAVIAFFVKENGSFSNTKSTDTVTDSVQKQEKISEVSNNHVEESVKTVTAKETLTKEIIEQTPPQTITTKTQTKIVKKTPISSVVKKTKSDIIDKKDKKRVDTHYKSYDNTLNVVLPTPPKPPVAIKVVTIGSSSVIKPRRVIKPLSTKMPTSLLEKKESVKKVEVVKEKVKKVATTSDVKVTEEKESVEEEKEVVVANTGITKNGRVSTYLRGSFVEAEEATKKLKDAGFKILSTSVIDKKGLLTTIVFTNEKLTSYANKKDRGFNSTFRVLIDKSNKQLTVTNPLYFARAYMQDDFDKKVTKELIYDVNKAFSGLHTSKDKLKYTLLPKYQFMFSMPYYDDMIDVAKASSNDELISKLKKSKSLVFSHNISKNRDIVGVNIGKDTSNFIDIIGYMNALLLPYPVLLENGVAKILSPKYYISISYPMLKMSQFMKISSVPDEIEKDCKNLFK